MGIFGFFKKNSAKGRANNRGSTARSTGSTRSKGYRSQITGRQGASSNPSSNESGGEFQFSQSFTLSTVSQTPTFNLNFGSDCIGWSITVTLAMTGNTNTTADQLTAFQQWQILGPGGNLMNIQPAPDWYMLAQRFGPQHVKPTVVAMNGTTATTGYYVVYGINLPALNAPNHYSLLLGIQPYTSIGTASTGGTVTITIESMSGDAQGVTSHYAYSNLPFTPSANGTNDLVPVAPIQDVDLVELFLSGLTSNVADVAFFQSTDVGPHILPQTIIQGDNARFPGTTMDTDKLYPLMALETNLNLTMGTHFYANWGASPSNSIRAGFYWLD